jgi:DNA-directed RNA polymerase subunit alpha
MNQPMFEVKEDVKQADYGQFVISPLEQGYGLTMGNSLRRVLLSSLTGTAITSVKIAGVKHQFSSLTGMKEDIVEFILNLKKVRFTGTVDKVVKATLEVSKPGEFKAGEIKVAGLTVANPDLVLGTINKGSKISAEMTVESGVGYSPAEERATDTIGLIPMDAAFSPVKRVSYKVEETRVGRLTNYDKLTLEVWTDGTVNPSQAFEQSAKVLVSYFGQIVNPKKVEKAESAPVVSDLGAVGKLSVEEIGLPTRVANALIKAGFETVEQLANARKEDLVKVRNLGEKSLKIIAAALGTKGVEFLAIKQ